MAEDEETPQEEAEAVPEKPAKGRRKRRSAVEKPVSLHPLSFEEAVQSLLQVKPEPEKKKSKR